MRELISSAPQAPITTKETPPERTTKCPTPLLNPIILTAPDDKGLSCMLCFGREEHLLSPLKLRHRQLGPRCPLPYGYL